MGSSGGGDPKMPSAQKRLYALAYPLAKRMATAGVEGAPLWDVPEMPTVPGPVMPSSQWYQGIAPEVRAGVWAPYQEAAQQLGETFGSRGQMGSPRAGPSGAYGAAMGSFAADAARDVGMQTWQMTYPQMQQYRDELYASALQQRGEVMQAQQAPYTMMPGYIGSMGGLPQYATPARPSPWAGAAGGAMTGAAMGGMTGNPYIAAAGAIGGGIYGYYANR